MTLANKNPQATPAQPNLSNLLARYLQRQAEAQASGVAAADPVGEVMPYEVGPVQPIDAKPAWDAAIAVAKYYGVADAKTLQAPPQWPQLVAAHEPETALPFCLGNFPQLVRNLQALMQAKDLSSLRPAGGRPVPATALVDWAEKASAAKQFPRLLLALGALRLAKQFDAADKIVAANAAAVPAVWKDAWANETAALAWDRGHFDQAMLQWTAMKPSIPVFFNRGMAALFCGKPADGRGPLAEAVKQLPETSPWHHLGQLYLTMLRSN